MPGSAPPSHTDSAGERRYRFAFVVEYAIGHVTFANMLQAAVARDPAVDADWFFMRPDREGRLERLPPLSRNYTFYMGLRVLRRVSRYRRRIDAVLIHTQTAALLWWPMMHSLPTVISTDGTPRNIDELSAAYIHRQGSTFEEVLKQRIIGGMLRSTAHIVPWSDWAKHSIVHDYRVPERQVTIIRPGVDLDRWGREHHQRSGPTRLLFVGGDFRRKGGPDLLSALATVSGDWALHVVTKSEVPRDERISVYQDITPDDPRLAELYESADVFVLPTLGDTYGWALLEAMAARLPIISTSVGAIPEIVHHGVNGFVVPPSSPQELAATLQTLIDDPALRLTMGARSYEMVRDQHDALTSGQAILQVLKDVSVPARQPAADL